MNNNPVANLDNVKQYNLARLFKIIVEYGLVSRTQLIEISNLAAGSVTKLTRLLIEQGLIHEVSQLQSERGRKAVLLAPKSDDIQILAARADRQFIYVGLCDLSGNLIHRTVEPLAASTQAEFVSQLSKALQAFLSEQTALIKHIIGVGVTLPGVINAELGRVISMPHIPIQNLELGELLKKQLNLPCYLNNFSSAMALAEKQVGASFNAKDSFFVEVHNGVSAGLIINNQLLSGIGVGEIGHIQVDTLGKLCTCGHYGCLETVISNTAIVAHYAERTDQQSNEPLSIQHVIEQALAFDENAIAVLKKAMAHLGTAIANMINVFRPETIIIAGEITQAWSIIEPVLNQQISTKSLQIEGFEHIPIVRSDLYDSPWYSGYALVREALLGGELLPNLLLEDSPAESVSND